MNATYRTTKLQNRGHDGKLDIVIQKVKVKKMDFNLYFLRNKSNCIHVYTT